MDVQIRFAETMLIVFYKLVEAIKETLKSFSD